MPARNRTHWALWALGAVTTMSACNALLDNDPRSWEPDGDGAAVGGAHDHGRAGGGGTADGSGAKPTADGGTTSDGSGAKPTAGGGTTSDGGDDGGAAGHLSSGCDGGNGGDADALGRPCAPPSSDCTPGHVDSQDVPCGACNAGMATRTRTCAADHTWGPWSAPGECRISVACEPGDVGMEKVPCGDCMTGQQARTKACTASCTWGEWQNSGQCTGVTATCKPGTPESRSVACPCSGSKTQTRTCSASCSWGGWSDTSSCDLECCSEIVYCDTPDNVATNRGTWCRRTDGDCSTSELDRDCAEDIQSVCGAVTAPLYTQY